MASDDQRDLQSGLESPHNVPHSPRAVLVLHNDDVHSFDYVIDSLVEVCKHEHMQAAQCAYLVHYKGLYDVKLGALGELRSMKTRLSKKGLKATIVSENHG